MSDARPPRPSSTSPSSASPSSASPSVETVAVPSSRTPQRPDEGPSDRTTLTAVLDAYRASGFASDFFAEETGGSEGTSSPESPAQGSSAQRSPAHGSPARTGAPGTGAIVRCGRCASALDPRTVEMHSIRRLEGASDPADMVAVVATTCPVCGSDGTLVVSYGPMASAVDAEVLLAMRDRRSDDVLPPSIAPDEAAQPDGGHPAPGAG